MILAPNLLQKSTCLFAHLRREVKHLSSVKRWGEVYIGSPRSNLLPGWGWLSLIAGVQSLWFCWFLGYMILLSDSDIEQLGFLTVHILVFSPLPTSFRTHGGTILGALRSFDRRRFSFGIIFVMLEGFPLTFLIGLTNSPFVCLKKSLFHLYSWKLFLLSIEF